MSQVESTQRGATRNQSTVDYSRKQVFVYGNRYRETVFLNNSGAALDISDGLLLIRNAANADQVIPAVAGNTLENVIGFLKIGCDTNLADGSTINASVCISGDVDAELLTLPATVTLNTVAGPAGSKVLKDALTGLGFVLQNVTENSQTDN